MKKADIVIVVTIVIAIGAMMVAINDSSTYVDFAKAEASPGTRYTVIGYLDKEAKMNYDAHKNSFTFTAIDKTGQKSKVFYNQPKPQDFEHSEEITMKGFATDSNFIANEILMKCPSKYNGQNKMASYDTY